MACCKVLNLMGLFFVTGGSLLMYFFPPWWVIPYGPDGGAALILTADPTPDSRRKALRNQVLACLALVVFFLGFVLQLSAALLDFLA